MLTADTITDEQIRELQDWLDRAVLEASFAALDPHTHTDSLREQIVRSRARCAEILNSRAAKEQR